MSSTTQRLESEDTGMSLQLAGDPARILAVAKQVGDELMKVIERKDKSGEPLFYKMMGKNRHLKLEAWLFMGNFFALTPRTVFTEPYLDELSGGAGYKARVEIIDGRGVPRAVADALCLNNEDNWGQRPKYERQNGDRTQVGMVPVPSYQLMSMAQTRAASKALASRLRWIVVLCGAEISTTPAEEMSGTEGRGDTGKDKDSNGERELISDKERKQIFGAAKSRGIGFAGLPPMWQKHGFDRADQITKAKFKTIIGEIEALAPKQPAAQS